METEHTPGPWRNRQGLIFGTSKGGCQLKESDFMVAQIRGWGHLQYLGEEKAIAIQEANARLIAAAPELLAACEAAIKDTRGLSPSDYLHTTTMNMIKSAISNAKKG